MKLSDLIEKIRTDGDGLILTKNGQPVAVLVSPDKYASWRETQLIWSDADLMTEIKQGLEALKEKRASFYTLDELYEN